MKPSTLRDLSDAGLYNLSEDIGETRNRAAERPDKVQELGDLWQQWNRQLAKPVVGTLTCEALAKDLD